MIFSISFVISIYPHPLSSRIPYKNPFFKQSGNLWFWCKDKIKENIAHIFRAELYFMLLAQTFDG
ncbi:hypothetical protein CQZ94_29890 [Bacillus sp. MYb209]|nr:hypothetical protein CQZ94_29890 [Bacillus sp. MYb209]